MRAHKGGEARLPDLSAAPAEAEAGAPQPDPPPASRRRRRAPVAALADVGMAAGVVGIGFALFQPDWYHIQNGLDPFFYTGLSLNLSDALDYGTDAHYFVSRWTLYVPELVAQRLLGPSAGFVAFRLVLLLLAGLGLALLRPAASRRLDLLPVAVVGLFSPLLLRAVFVDYSDAIVVPGGIVMLALAAKGRVGPLTSASIGVVAGAVVVANVFAVFMVTITIGAYLARSLARPRRLAAQLPVLAAGGAAVLLAGLVLFRWRFGVDVYAPTVDFVRGNVGFDDPLKQRNLRWLKYQLWIFLPPLVLAAAAALRAGRLLRLGEAEWVVLGVCAAQYAFQVAYQVVFGGLTLELTYYFSYMVPATILALAVVLYGVLQRCSAAASLAAAGAAVVAFTAWQHLPPVNVGSWVVFAGAVALIAAALAAFGRRWPVVLPVGVAVVAVAAQLAAPRRPPVAPGELRVQPGYDSVYRSEATGVQVFRSASTFVRRMHGLDPAVRKGAGWILAGGISSELAATYSLQVAEPDRWVNPPSGDPDDELNLSGYSESQLRAGRYTHLVVLCSPEKLPAVVDRLAALGFTLGPPLLDYVETGVEQRTQVYVAPVAPAAPGSPPPVAPA